MKWRIVGFDHPNKEKSLLYKQGLTDDGLHKAVKDGIEKGCNLFILYGLKEASQ